MEKDLEKVFKCFDVDGDGKISATELAAVLKAVGSSVSRDELQLMMEEMDVDGDGFINRTDFLAFFAEGGGDAELREAFGMYDLDGNGVITAKELNHVLTNLGEKCSVDDCGKMIKSVDADGDGCVSFEEFKTMMGEVGAADSTRTTSESAPAEK